MEEITTAISDRRKAGTCRTRKHNPKTDMTPMVDLGFLLISFFVITTELSKPASLDLILPKDGPTMPLGQSDALTVLLDKNNSIYYYHGNWNKAIRSKMIFKTSLSTANGLGKLIRDKQQSLDRNNHKDGRNGLMLLIKPNIGSEYGDVVDMLDEALIHQVKKYAVLKLHPEEIKYLHHQE